MVIVVVVVIQLNIYRLSLIYENRDSFQKVPWTHTTAALALDMAQRTQDAHSKYYVSV